MEPRREEPHHEEPSATSPRPEEKRKRFRIVKLEERIAPTQGGDNPTNRHCHWGSGGFTCAGSIE